MRRYLVLALVSFVAYSLVAPLLKVAMETIPSTTAVVMSNTLMFLILGGALLYTRTSPFSYVSHPKAPLILVWGITLSVSLLSYYRALALGPVSIVVPIYGLFIAVSSFIGIAVLDETLTRRKVASIVLAVLAITLMSI
jgi:transporter family protein